MLDSIKDNSGFIESNNITPIKEKNTSRHINSDSKTLSTKLKAIALILLTALSGGASATGEASTTVQFSSNYHPSLFPQTCRLSAYVAPGHAFVNFDCGEMNGAYGFYPHDRLRYFPHMGQAIDSGTLKGVGSIEGIAASSSYIIPAHSSSSASSSSSSSVNPASVFASAGIKKGAANGANSYFAFNDVRALSNLELESEIIEDDYYLELCQRESCQIVHVNVTQDKALEAWKQVQLIRTAGEHSREDMSSKEPVEDFKYYAVGNNCVDFMERIMDSAGVSDVKNKLVFNKPPTLLSRITGLAWNYLAWK